MQIPVKRIDSSRCVACHYTVSRRKAFTLIEVLVVVAIIALLISILLPSLRRTRSQARAAICLANLHRIGHASVFYTNQYGAFPPVRLTKMYDPAAGTWEKFYLKIRHSEFRRATPRWGWFFDYGVGPVIQPGKYATEADFNAALEMDNNYFLCPSLTGEHERDIRNGAYGYNWQYLGNSLITVGDRYARWPVKVSYVKAPARTVLMADSRGGGIPHGLHSYTLDPPRLAEEFDATRFGPSRLDVPDQLRHSPVEMRHNGRGNVAFVDGHAEAMLLRQLGYALDENGVTIGNGSGAVNTLWNGYGRDSLPSP